MTFTVSGVGVGVGVGVDVSRVWVGVADVVVRVGLADVAGALLMAGLDEGLPDGEKSPSWLTRNPTRANRSSRIRAINGQVQGLRPLRRGSSAGSSSYAVSSGIQFRSAARAFARASVPCGSLSVADEPAAPAAIPAAAP